MISSKELDKYEYLTGEDLALKPGPIEIKQAEYSPAIKTDDKVKKVIKKSNDLTYDSVYNFNKYSVSNFNEINLTH